MILKFLLITFLVIFILVRFFGWIFRTMFWLLGMRAGQRQHPYYRQTQQARPAQRREGEVTIDYVPEHEKQKRKNGFNDGEYVSYEEVK